MEDSDPAGLPSGTPTIAPAEVRGAFFQTQHVGRTVIIYPITETELKTFSLLNALGASLSSVGFGLITFAAGLVASWRMQGQVSEGGKVLVQVVAPVLGVLGALFLVAAVVVWRIRGSELERVKRESRISARSDRDNNFEVRTRAWGEFNLWAEVYLTGEAEPIMLERYLNL